MYDSAPVLPDQESAVMVGRRMLEFFTGGARAGGSEGSSSMEASDEDEDEDDEAPIWRYNLCAACIGHHFGCWPAAYPA